MALRGVISICAVFVPVALRRAAIVAVARQSDAHGRVSRHLGSHDRAQAERMGPE
jgi:hypothetical protein